MYGPYDHLEPDRAHFIGGIMARAIREQRAGSRFLSVWGRPDAVRECLHVDDQIDAVFAAEAVFENTVVNCAANSPATIDAVAHTIARTLEWNVPIAYPGGTFQGVDKKVLDSSRFLAATSWRPRITLEDGLCKLAEEVKARL
jgi:GDP-L-fucose synthase